MAMPLPKVSATLSDVTKIGYDDLDSTVAKLLFLDVTPANSTDFGAAWTKVESTVGNVTVSGGVVSMVGNGTRGNNGMYLAAGLAIAEGYIEYKFQIITTVASSLDIFISNTGGAIPSSLAVGNAGLSNSSTLARATIGGQIPVSPPIVSSTYYTLRQYLKKDDAGNFTTYKQTITGGIYTTETTVLDVTRIPTAWLGTIYPSIQRLTAAGTATNVKEFKAFFGYSTAGETVEFVHDAGAGKTFDNFDMTDMAVPASMAATNEYAYYFGNDAGGAYSAFQLLADFKANGKITGRYRYIKIKVEVNSDGATQAYACKPNSDTATDGAGDFPDVDHVLTNDTVQLVQGTASSGSLAAPAVPTWATNPITNIGSTKQRATWLMTAITGGPTATYELSSNGSTADIATGIVSLSYLRSSLTASTLYTYYVRARNDAGVSAWSTPVSETTDAARAIAASISRDLVTAAATITTANGYNTNVVCSEMERQIEHTAGRLPMIEVCGPAVNISARSHTQGDLYELEYALVYKANLNDDDVAVSPVTVQTENVAADIIKAVMADHTRGGHAIMTKPTDYFHTLDTVGPGMNMFTVVVTFQIQTIVDSTNPYLIG